MLILPRRYSTSRPAGPFVLNRGSLQAQGLRFWITPGIPPETPLDRVTGTILTRGTSTTDVMDEEGRARNYAGTGERTDIAIGTLSEMTFTARAMFAATGGMQPLVYMHSNVFELILDATDLFAAYSGSWAYNRSGYVPTAGKWHSIAVSLGPNGRLMFVDGVQVASWVPAWSPAGPSSIHVGNRWDTSWAMNNGRIADERVYDRALSPAEIWHQYDPATRWDLYWQPSGRTLFWPDVISGAPATPTIFRNTFGTRRGTRLVRS